MARVAGGDGIVGRGQGTARPCAVQLNKLPDLTLARVFTSIIQTGQRRVAIEDIELDGEVIRAVEGIILDVPPANWDARRYPDPDRLDLQRQDNPHVSFGCGRHQCVGQQLARMELQIVLHTLLRRIPTLRLAVPVAQLPFKHDALAYRLYELPVTW
jgi:cytochrome P450